MTRFTTRVELYGDPNYETYTKLHNAMLQGGFSRQITFDKVTYWLPNAEYTYSGDATQESVKNKAVSIAATLWKEFGVLVTKTEVDRAHHNLKKVVLTPQH